MEESRRLMENEGNVARHQRAMDRMDQVLKDAKTVLDGLRELHENMEELIEKDDR